MKNLTFLILAIFSSLLLTHAQEPYYFSNDTSHFIKVDGEDIRAYLAKNLSYPISVAKSKRIGTMIGCVRVTPNAELVDVFVVNSVASSLDAIFISTLKHAFKKRQTSVNELRDTTDFFIQVKYTLGKERGDPYDFHVEPNKGIYNLSKEIILVLYIPVAGWLMSDEEVFTPINSLYQAGNYKKCIHYLDELIRRNPFNEDIVFMRANAYARLGKMKEAKADYNYLRYFLRSAKHERLDTLFDM
ncbi:MULTISPECIES: tetratricopeptide repeat protein [unclassified Carboxylicivirga]|uniref:tetratricopeptide repeat protein n=1 Tax=Carboxylicivirga TaxID=1628153 RepID=UPI003D355B3B